MNHNLAVAWADKSSPPQTPDLAFYSPQADDLLFSTGATIEIRCQAGRRSVSLAYTLARNTLQTPFLSGTAAAQPANRYTITLPTARLQPGFYDLRVKLDLGTAVVAGVCTFGWRVHELPVVHNRPADFAAFWAAAKASIAQLPLAVDEAPLQHFTAAQINAYNVQHACLPPDYDPAGHVSEEVWSSKVSFAGPDGGRVYGWLAKPAGPGPFPVMLVLPGAGFAARPRPLEHARHGYLALDLQVHGQDVDLPKYGPAPAYTDTPDWNAPERFYYYHVHLRCQLALRYLLARPDADARRVVVVGGSQGGRLSIITAALEPRVTAVVAAIAHHAYLPYLVWAEACNAAGRDGMDVALPPLALDTPKALCMAYYDVLNFAPDVRAAVLMNAGLIDPVSPAENIYAAYRALGSPRRTMIPLDGMAHDWSAEFDRRAWPWLAKL